VQEYLTQVERLPDGSLWATLYGSGRRLHQEPVRTLRHGKRRAYDLLCTAVDTGLDADPSGGPAVPGPGSPVAGSVPAREPAGAVGSGPGTGSSVRDAAGAFSARAAAEAVRAAAASPSADAALQVVIQMVLRSGPWDAASISVRGPGGTMRPAASSDARAADADRLQFEVGEGPCLDAVHPEPDGPGTERLVVAVDLAIEQRWPRLGPAVTALGIRSVAVLRLFTGHTVGSISLYAQHPTGLDRKAVDDARVVAALASVVLARVCTERDLWRGRPFPGSDRAGAGHVDAALRSDRGVSVRGVTPVLAAAQHETGCAGRPDHHDGGAARLNLAAVAGPVLKARTRQIRIRSVPVTITLWRQNAFRTSRFHRARRPRDDVTAEDAVGTGGGGT